jgi:hypothetical protein
VVAITVAVDVGIVSKRVDTAVDTVRVSVIAVCPTLYMVSKRVLSVVVTTVVCVLL